MIIKKSNGEKWRPDLNALSLEACIAEKSILVFVDTETTGLNPDEDDIIQFSGIKYVVQNGELSRMNDLDIFIKNTKPIPEEITKINHISEQTLENAPTPREAFEIINAFLSDATVFVAYNTPFDYAFTKTLYARQGCTFKPQNTFDVMSMVIDLISVYKCNSRKLERVAKYLKLSSGNEQFHNSLDDIEMTAKVYEKLLSDYQKLIQDANMTQGSIIPKIASYRYWKSDKIHQMERLYFYTDYGAFYFDIRDRSFGNDASYPLQDINMNAFVRSILKRFNVRSIEELSHKKFSEVISG